MDPENMYKFFLHISEYLVVELVTVLQYEIEGDMLFNYEGYILENIEKTHSLISDDLYYSRISSFYCSAGGGQQRRRTSGSFGVKLMNPL